MKFRLLVLSVLLFTGQVYPQSPAKILKAAESALGGTKLLRSVTSWRKTGEITRKSDSARGRILLLSAKPNLFTTSFDLNGFEAASGYNSKSAWHRDSREGLRTLTGPASLNLRAEAGYRSGLWLDYKKNKSKIVSGGRGEVDGRPANVVVLKTVQGVEIKISFDAVSGLPVREEFSSGGQAASYEYSDFRRVQGVMQPFGIVFKTGGETYQIMLTNVLMNDPVAAAEFDFPKTNDGPLPDIATLLRDVQANEERIETLLETYAFTEKRTARELTKTGVLKDKDSETFQISFYKGFRINRLIEKNGQPLEKNRQNDADRDAEKRVEEIEKIIAKRTARNSGGDEDRPRMSIAEILRASNLLNPRQERFRGREVIVFDFEPNASFDYKNAKSMLRFFGKTAGVIWIDAKDKQVARIEAVLADSFNIGGGVVAKLKKGASFTLEQERINDEIWLPSSADINLSVRVFLIKGIDLNQSIRSYDYRKFKTEVNDATVNEAAKP